VFDFSIAGCLATMRSKRSARPFQAAATGFGGSCQAPLSRPPWLTLRPCGTAFSIAARTAARLSGRSLALSEVSTAIMPQPMSTPTAAGMIAPTVGITLPTVAPMPQCTSGIAATQRWMNGMRATFSS
jgi:hypothetical protein